MSLTIVMITLNEEKRLEGCLESLKGFCDSILIVDSYSSDNTVEIAKSFGAKVVKRHFTNFGDQWNYAISSTAIDTKWTMKLDPDERLTKNLKEEIMYYLNNDHLGDFSSLSFKRRLWFAGKPVNVYDTVKRIWLTGSCKFSDSIVNEHPIVKGKDLLLKSYCEHLDSIDLSHWLKKQNLYTTQEAQRRLDNNINYHSEISRFSDLNRRVFLKKMFNYLPFKFTIYLLYCLFVKGSILGGKHGIMWARMRVFVFRMRLYKFIEKV